MTQNTHTYYVERLHAHTHTQTQYTQNMHHSTCMYAQRLGLHLCHDGRTDKTNCVCATVLACMHSKWTLCLHMLALYALLTDSQKAVGKIRMICVPYTHAHMHSTHADVTDATVYA